MTTFHPTHATVRPRPEASVAVTRQVAGDESPAAGRARHGSWWWGVTAVCAGLLAVGWGLGTAAGTATNEQTNSVGTVEAPSAS